MKYGDFSRSGHSANGLRKALKPEDRFKLKLKEHEIPKLIQEISDKYYSTAQSVEKISRGHFRGKPVFITKLPYDKITIRRTAHLISKFLDPPQVSKDKEVAQLYNIIQSELTNEKLKLGDGRLLVFKGDIQDFFESCNFQNIIKNIELEGFSAKSTLNHLIKIHKAVSNNGCTGLPRGLPISSCLSEFALKKFDQNIRETPSVIYYSRYVDDFVILYCDHSLNMLSHVSSKLSSLGFTLHPSKSRTLGFIGEDVRFDFLGYSISLTPGQPLKVSTKKIKRTKARIHIAILESIKTQDFKLLLDRLLFLASSTSILKFGRKKPIKIGFRHQYALCTKESIRTDLKDLDRFLKGLLYSKRLSSSQKLRSLIPEYYWRQITNISFYKLYFSKKSTRCGHVKMKSIQNAWKYAKI